MTGIPCSLGGARVQKQHTTTDAKEATTMSTTKTATANEATTGRGHSTVSGEGTARCGSCRTTLSVRKFPTARQKDGTYARSLAECRSCRKTRREAARAEKQTPKPTAA